MEKSLWGNLVSLSSGVKNPKDILEEQAEVLKESLDGLVKCRLPRFLITKEWKEFYKELKVESDFSFSFIMFSDYVENYEYEICKLTYGIKMYPLAISFGTGIAEELQEKFVLQDDDTIVVQNEEQLKSVMKEILSSKEVHQVLQGLLIIAKKEKETLDFLF